METDSLKWVGSSCGLHGPYIFYKAFKFYRDGKARILSLGDFFLVRCTPEDPICIAELQLLWEERTTKQLLSSSKLYFLPEDTPSGRTVNHGEDEVVGVSEKVILRLGDLVKWTAGDLSAWARGRRPTVPGVTAVPKAAVLRELGTNGHREPRQGSGGHRPAHTHLSSHFRISLRDVLREKAQIDEDAEERAKVLVLSYPQYCRYRCIHARLQGARDVAVVTERIVRALGGIGPLHGDVHVLYCRETFQHTTLGHNQSVCEHFAPNLKGRPRKRKLSQRREDQNLNPNQPLQTGPPARRPARTAAEPRPPPKVRTECRVVVAKVKNVGMCKREEGRREREKEEKEGKARRERQQAGEQAFLAALHQYMKKRQTPIERIPYLGFKQINLWTMFQTAQKLGGYEQITARRQWKQVYDELGGHPGSTSAATCTRRHYERLLLPYERYSKGQEEGPGVEFRPIKAEPVSIAESTDQGSSPISSHPNSGAALKQEPQSDTQPQSSVGSDDGEGLQHSVHLRDVSINSKTEMEEEEEEELKVTVKQVEALSTQANHHDNHQPANHIHADLSLQTDRKHPSPSVADPSGRLCHQDEDASRGSLSQGEARPPEAHWQASSPGHHSLQPLGALEPCVSGSIPEREMEPEGPVREAAEGSPPGALIRSRGLEGSPPNAHSGALTSSRGLEGAPPNAHSGALIRSRGLEGAPPNAHSAPYFSTPHSVLSPLAKKKLLSQVCAGGGCAPQNYPTAPPAAARSDVTARGGSCSWGVVSSTLDPVGQQGAPPAHPSSPETASAARPSVIQHGQSSRPPCRTAPGERTPPAGPPGERTPPAGSPGERTPPAGPESCRRDEASPQAHLLPTATHEQVLECVQMRTCEETVASGHRAQVFYSSPHLQSLDRHTKHRLSQQHHRQHQHLGTQVQVCPSRAGATGEIAGAAQNIPDVVIDERYSTQPLPAHLGHHGTSVNMQAADEPAGLSPRKTPPAKGHNYPTMHGDCRVPAPIQLGLDAHGISCHRFPVPIRNASLAYKVSVPAGVSGTGGVKRPGGLWQTSETVRGVRRPLEGPERRAPPAKTRALCPRLPGRQWSAPAGSGGCARVSERQGEEAAPAEPARAVHLNSYSSQGHRCPQHARHLGGLCPAGTFGAQEGACEGPRAVGYPPPHPLAFLKSRGGTVATGVAPPFVLHALMMQGQLVRSPAQTFVHQASSAHRTGRFSEPTPHGMYPLRPFNPPHTHPAPQLPAVQPNTQL
ncbi:AT-rich interactive domain-containing protein 5B-like [Alosa alosa]|uniref:AT-rich interactive domain-containing protein 5B-like n=1 Tax=Alosa alosa TaxID=278164 RepID=UPI0020152A09|nr:AT-rich interactive domain-containing protein 5B-like [Alosa alosa]